MMEIVPQPLTADAFAPFGQVFATLDAPGRVDDLARLENRREQAAVMLSTVHVPPTALPLNATVLERHRFSSQTFVPMDVARYLVIVAPHAAAGGPDLAGVQAFIAGAGQGISYNTDTWHHGMTVLDRPGHFAIFMWNDGSDGDTEFLTLTKPFVVMDNTAS